MAEGLDTEKVKASAVRVVYGKGDSTMIGSGFFVANDKIATNIHILADADLASLHVRTDNANYTIQGVTAFDAKNDLVILQISGEGIPLVLGNSDAVSSGETVFCIGYIGYPVDKFNAMENTVLPGRLSGVWLRVTPTTLPGNSGGPVLNTVGEVIGINVTGSGSIGYAIGSNILKELLKQSGPIEPLVQWQKRDPIRACTFFIKASRAFYDADYAGAIDALDKVIALNPTYANIDTIYNNRGHVKSLLAHSKFYEYASETAQEDYRAAIQDLDKSISLNSVNGPAYANRGDAKTLFGHSELIRGRTAEARQYYRAAIDDFSKTISLKSDFAEAYYNRAVAKQMLGQKDAARADFEKAAQLDQDEGK